MGDKSKRKKRKHIDDTETSASPSSSSSPSSDDDSSKRRRRHRHRHRSSDKSKRRDRERRRERDERERKRRKSRKKSRAYESESESESEPELEPEAVVGDLLNQFPNVSNDLIQLLQMIDDGQAVDIKGPLIHAHMEPKEQQLEQLDHSVSANGVHSVVEDAECGEVMLENNVAGPSLEDDTIAPRRRCSDNRKRIIEMRAIQCLHWENILR
nr:hypothetical protein CFP56_45922 [Quercus suber]